MKIPIVRVRDEDGNIIEIPAIKGEKGDKGDPGLGADNMTASDVICADGKTVEEQFAELWQDEASMAESLEQTNEAVEATEAARKALAQTVSANAQTMSAHTGNKQNPHGVTLAQLGAADVSKTVSYKNDPLQITDLGAVPSIPGIWLTSNAELIGAPDDWTPSRNAIVRMRPGNDQYALDFLANYNSQKLAARIGAAKAWFELITSNGGAVRGQLDVTGNPTPLRMAGVDHVYLPFYKNGLSGGLSGYIGYSSAEMKNLRVSNELTGGAVDVRADGGLLVNGEPIVKKADKPGNSYVGDGNSARRTVSTGGTGEVILVYSQHGLALVTRRGSAIVSGTGGITWSSEALFSDGVLTLSSVHGSLNTNGETYYYQVL